MIRSCSTPVQGRNANAGVVMTTCVSLAIVDPGADADHARSCAENSVLDKLLLDKPDHPIDKHEEEILEHVGQSIFNELSNVGVSCK